MAAAEWYGRYGNAEGAAKWALAEKAEHEC